MEKRKIIGMFVFALIALLAINIVSAEFWACFADGEVVHYCNDYKPPKTCDSSHGCQWCMSVYDETEDCYVHGSWPQCQQLTQECGVFGDGTIDEEPPEFGLLSPLNNSVFTTRQALVEFSLNERADVYFLDLINGRGRWSRICSDCNPGNPSYSKARSFDEGYNLIQFRATDVVGNEVFETVNFFIDSKDPKIKKAEPKKGFANGRFYVEIQEENPKHLILYYGNYTHELDIEADCEASTNSNKKYYCLTEVNLISYDNQQIEYWWTLEDIAGNIDEYKHQFLDVDYSAPVINSLEHYNDGKKDYIRVEFEEANLEEVTYLDLNDPKAKEKRLCTKADSGVCDEKINLGDGWHDVQVTIYDEAGNQAGSVVGFYVDSKDPKIKKTEPKKGFADGNVYVEFDEANPVNLILYYGNDSQILNIDNDCIFGKRNYECSTNVDLSSYDGQDIKYWFSLEDIIGNVEESKKTEISVDTTFPVVKNPGSFYSYTAGERDVYFNIQIDEENFDEVTYTYLDWNGKLKEKRLCSRLYEGVCEAKERFNFGEYNITLSVKDEAGNSIGLPASFEISY